MILLPYVCSAHVHPQLWLWLHVLEDNHWQATGHELVIASPRCPSRSRPSRHSPPAPMMCRAVDIRRWHLDARGLAEPFARELQHYYGAHLGVILEPEWLTENELRRRGGRAAVAPRLHVQLKEE